MTTTPEHEPLRIANPAGAWATLTVRLQSPDQDLLVPATADIARAMGDLFSGPLLVGDVFLHHHGRWLRVPAVECITRPGCPAQTHTDRCPEEAR